MLYAISDIHGCCATFKALVNEHIKLKKTDKLFLLGDFIDRGPDSKGVLDFVMELIEKEYQVFPLIGNHEWMLLKGFEQIDVLQSWLANGGRNTLASFGVQSINEIPAKYLEFIRSFALYVDIPKFYLVHAGFNFEDNNFLENKYSMLWIRNWYEDINHELLGNKIVIHGHTPQRKEAIRADFHNMRYPVVNIDAGCFSNKEGYGHLCAINLTKMELLFQPNIDYMF
jgi:serine/threonine protein phosphatase 1